MPRRKDLNPNVIQASDKIDIEEFRESVKGAFTEIEDPRSPDRIVYPMWYILLIVLAGYMSGCNTIAELEAFGRIRHGWLVGLTGVAMGAPSYDTIWMLLVRTTPDGLKALFQKWFHRLSGNLKGLVLALDGKRARGATYLDNIIHLVELVVTDTGFTLTQQRVSSKEGESSALEPILDLVNVERAILSMDALYTTTKVATLIQTKKADYILALKKNQGYFHAEVRNFFDQARKVKPSEAGIDTCSEMREGHGRKETIQVTVCSDLDWLPQKDAWPGLTSLIEVVNVRDNGSESSRATRYYISSCQGTAAQFAGWIRSHWSIENNVHWVADVIFKEDASKASIGYIQENMAIFRRLVMNIIRTIDPGVGMADARRMCNHSDRYLIGLLATLFGKSL